MLCAARHDDLFGLVVETVFDFQFFGDGLADFKNAYGSGVAGLAFADGLAGRILNRCRCRKIRFACTEAYDILAVGNHLLGQCVDGDC